MRKLFILLCSAFMFILAACGASTPAPVEPSPEVEKSLQPTQEASAPLEATEPDVTNENKSGLIIEPDVQLEIEEYPENPLELLTNAALYDIFAQVVPAIIGDCRGECDLDWEGENPEIVYASFPIYYSDFNDGIRAYGVGAINMVLRYEEGIGFWVIDRYELNADFAYSHADTYFINDGQYGYNIDSTVVLQNGEVTLRLSPINYDVLDMGASDPTGETFTGYIRDCREEGFDDVYYIIEDIQGNPLLYLGHNLEVLYFDEMLYHIVN